MHAISLDYSDESSTAVPVLSDILVSHPLLSYPTRNENYTNSNGTPSYHE